MRKRNPIEESLWRYEQAQEALVRAAERLYFPPTRERRAEALFYAALAMLRLAQADTGDDAMDEVIAILRRVQQEQPPAAPEAS